MKTIMKIYHDAAYQLCLWGMDVALALAGGFGRIKFGSWQFRLRIWFAKHAYAHAIRPGA